MGERESEAGRGAYVYLTGDHDLVVVVSFADPAYLQCTVPSLHSSKRMVVNADDAGDGTMGFWRLWFVSLRR